MGLDQVGKLILGVGLGLVVLGGALMLANRVPGLQNLGRLPGDIRVEREGMQVYFPLMTMLLASAVLTLIMWLIGQVKR